MGIVKTHAGQIMIAMVCAIATFGVTYFILDSNFDEKPVLPEMVSISFQPHHVSQLVVTPVHPVPAGETGDGRKVSITIHEILFHQNPALLLWAMVVLILLSIAAGAVPLFIWEIKRITVEFDLPLKSLWMSFLSSIVLMVVLALGSFIHHGFLLPDEVVDDFHILFKSGYLLKGIVGVTLLLSLPEGMLLFLIGYASDKLMDGINQDNPEKKTVDNLAHRFDLLNKGLAYGLQMLAIVVALTVLSLVVLGNAINNTITVTNFVVFPDAITVGYGLMLSLFLGILYVPTFLILSGQNKKLRDVLATYQDKNPGLNLEWVKGMSDLIDMKNPGRDNLKLALTILLPLITSLVPQLKGFSFGGG